MTSKKIFSNKKKLNLDVFLSSSTSKDNKTTTNTTKNPPISSNKPKSWAQLPKSILPKNISISTLEKSDERREVMEIENDIKLLAEEARNKHKWNGEETALKMHKDAKKTAPIFNSKFPDSKENISKPLDMLNPLAIFEYLKTAGEFRKNEEDKCIQIFSSWALSYVEAKNAGEKNNHSVEDNKMEDIHNIAYDKISCYWPWVADETVDNSHKQIHAIESIIKTINEMTRALSLVNAMRRYK